MSVSRQHARGSWFSRAVGAALALGLVASSAAGATLEEIEKDLTRKSEQLKSYTAKTASSHDMDLGEGHRTKMESTGTFEWIHRGEKHMYRSEGKTVTVQTMEGKEKKDTTKSLVVSDGEFAYTLADTDGEKSATKMKVMPFTATTVTESMFETMGKDNTIKVLPDEKFDGADCYVIETRPKKKPEDGYAGVQKMWFRKDVGIMVKSVSTNEKTGKPLYTMTTTDIKPNVDITPDRFKFKAPPGVEVMDLTKMQEEAARASREDRDGDTSAKVDKPDEPKEPTAEPAEKAEAKAEEKPPAEEKKKEDKKDDAVKGLLKGLLR